MKVLISCLGTHTLNATDPASRPIHDRLPLFRFALVSVKNGLEDY